MRSFIIHIARVGQTNWDTMYFIYLARSCGGGITAHWFRHLPLFISLSFKCFFLSFDIDFFLFLSLSFSLFFYSHFSFYFLSLFISLSHTHSLSHTAHWFRHLALFISLFFFSFRNIFFFLLFLLDYFSFSRASLTLLMAHTHFMQTSLHCYS